MSVTPAERPAEHIALEELPCACFIVTRGGTIRAANRRAGTLLATDPASLIGRQVLSLYTDGPQGRVRAQRLQQRFRAGHSIDGAVVAFRSAEQRTVWGQLWVQPISDDDGHIIESRSLVIDITAQHDAEAASRRSEQRFRAAFDDAPTAAALLDGRNRILRANAALIGLLGGADPTPAALTTLFAGAETASDDVDGERRMITPGDTPRWIRVTVTPISSDPDDDARGLAHLQDVTDARRLRRELESAATHDPLTGLLNRRGLVERGRAAFAAADRYRRPTGLLFLDVDGLKQVNDDHGHAAGDRLLRDVADALRRRFRAHDQLARWGGDEFCVLMEDTDRDQLERLVATWEETADTSSTGAGRLSAGIAVRRPGASLDLEALIDLADAAMYAARRRDPMR